jgi:hypothetical protein
MKQFILLIFIYVNCQAQLAPVGTVWNYFNVRIHSDGPSFYTYHYVITKDTLLGGKIYSEFSFNLGGPVVFTKRLIATKCIIGIMVSIDYCSTWVNRSMIP